MLWCYLHLYSLHTAKKGFHTIILKMFEWIPPLAPHCTFTQYSKTVLGWLVSSLLGQLAIGRTIVENLLLGKHCWATKYFENNAVQVYLGNIWGKYVGQTLLYTQVFLKATVSDAGKRCYTSIMDSAADKDHRMIACISFIFVSFRLFPGCMFFNIYISNNNVSYTVSLPITLSVFAKV